MVHRARSGYGRGENSITYTFLLMFRKMVEQFSPSKIYVVKEGKPQKRYDVFENYKATRSSPGDDFWRQHSDILKILEKMPVHIVRHPLRECDDTIAHLVNVIHVNDQCVVVSTDTDFIQLLSKESDRIKLWNPVKKSWVEATEYDYVQWKSLVGDASDEIPGFYGIGKKTAEKLLSSKKKLDEFFAAEEGREEKFKKNVFLIQFHEIEDEIERSKYSPNWNEVIDEFKNKEFHSLLKQKTLTKFIETFNTIHS